MRLPKGALTALCFAATAITPLARAPSAPDGPEHSVPRGAFLVSQKDALSAWLVAELQSESYAINGHATSASENISLAHDKRQTSWLRLRDEKTGEPLEVQPRCFSELVVLQLWDYARKAQIDVGTGRDVRKIIGAEWWYQVHGPSSAGISFHYDKDEGVASVHSVMRHPVFSTITYLSSDGAPTLIFNQTTLQGNIDVPVIPQQGYLVYPQAGRHVIFRGDVQHGVVGSLSPPTSDREPRDRITFLVNWWEAPEPLKPYTETLRNKTLKQLGLLKTKAVQRTLSKKGGLARGLATSERPVDVYIKGMVGEEVVRTRILVPPGDTIHFDMHRGLMKPGAIYNITWSDDHIFGGFGMLDLFAQNQVQGLFATKEAKLLLFYRTKEQGDDLLDFVPQLARRFVGHVKVYLCGWEANCANAFYAFGVQDSQVPIAAIHQTHPEDRKYLSNKEGPLDERKATEFTLSYLSGQLLGQEIAVVEQ